MPDYLLHGINGPVFESDNTMCAVIYKFFIMPENCDLDIEMNQVFAD